MDKLEFAISLEKRTQEFTDRVYRLCSELSKNIVVNEIIRQLVRSSGSIGANYIEANESLSTKDFFHRVKICRKESKETRYWLERLLKLVSNQREIIKELIAEVGEFILIFSKVVSKSKLIK